MYTFKNKYIYREIKLDTEMCDFLNYYQACDVIFFDKQPLGVI